MQRNLDRRWTDRRAWRRAGFAAAAALGVVLGTIAIAPAASAQSEGPLRSAISITARPVDSQLPCLPASLALGYEAVHSPEAFTLRISASAPLCEPIEASAAVYSMPGNGIPWPQELVEVESFTISRAGEIDVRFEKGCEPAQFDVLTGATPQTVAPWAEWHGPLLFPFDVDTAYQHWGADCADDSDGTPGAATTTTTEPPAAAPEDEEDGGDTTTTEPEVLAVVDEPPLDEQPEVLGIVQQPEQSGPAGLAFTGMSFRILAIAGLSLFLAGMAIAALGRRRA